MVGRREMDVNWVRNDFSGNALSLKSLFSQLIQHQ